jgi:opacity protein-like surface antigen
MKRSLRLIGLAAFLAIPAMTSAQETTRPVSFGLSGGLSLPMGDIGDAYDSGFNVTGHVMFRPGSFTNLSFRGDVNFDRFGSKLLDDVSLRLIGGTVNAVYAFPQATPGMIRPYVLAGVGMQNSKVNGSVAGVNLDLSTSSTDIHAQGGAGVNFQLSGFTTFVEAKFVNVFGDGSSSTYIPITFGFRF